MRRQRVFVKTLRAEKNCKMKHLTAYINIIVSCKFGFNSTRVTKGRMIMILIVSFEL